MERKYGSDANIIAGCTIQDKDGTMARELRTLRSFPHKDHEDNLDAEIIERSFSNISMASGVPVKYLRPEYPKINPEDIHLDLSHEPNLTEEKSVRQQMVDEIEKRIQDFGKLHGFPVAVVTTKEAVPPILCIGGRMYQDGFVHLFACTEIERAIAFAKMHDGNIEMRDGLMEPKKIREQLMSEPVLDGPLPSFCVAHHCTERGEKCAKCAYTAMGSMRRKFGG